MVPVLIGVIIHWFAPKAVTRVVPWCQVFAVIAFIFVTGSIVAKDASPANAEILANSL